MGLDKLDEAFQAAPGPEKPRKFTPSRYQKDIFDWIRGGKGHAVVEAVAGSGKTTSILEALALMKGKVLFCAFNKHIAEELGARAPAHAQVSTIHSLGFRAIRKVLGRVQIDGQKVRWIAERLVGDDPFDEEQVIARWALRQLVSLAKLTLTPGDDEGALRQLIYRYDIETNGEEEMVLGLAPDALRLDQEDRGTIDFDDMVWLPHVLKVKPPKHSWVCVDEAQDLNAAQRELVLAAARDGGRVVAVGDRRQAIYGFAGADTESIPTLTERLQAKTLPLSICYRCPKSHIELAKEIVPQIEPAEGAEEGKTEYTNLQKALDTMGTNDLVMCRINAPLADVALSLIRAGKKAVIRGRDISKGLLALVKRMRTDDLGTLLQKLTDYRVRETEKLTKAKKESRAEAIADRVETIIALADGIKSVRGLEHRIESIFSDQKEGVICSSVHRAKGLEADRTFIYLPQLMPLRFATEPWQLEQEENLRYVALTRAKKELWMVSE